VEPASALPPKREALVNTLAKLPHFVIIHRSWIEGQRNRGHVP
jgi:hypothetical protein